ncbi:MAG: 6-bladed beta-propeller, partial [Prevotellaceae bacterium]|nr:6-bladed beta-propeller [Prevotellaceae bacterium]
MNRNIILIIVCCLCTIIYSCNNEAVQIHSDASYIVNIDSAEDRGVFYLSSIVKSVRPILLEEPDYALIGDIYQMDIVDNHIFILDALVAKKMFMYDMNGKFLRQIGAMGEGPDEYRALADFCVDTERKEIYLLDRYKKLLKFNIRDGKHLETVNLPHGDFWYDELAYVDNSLYMDINHEELDVSNNRLLKL